MCTLFQRSCYKVGFWKAKTSIWNIKPFAINEIATKTLWIIELNEVFDYLGKCT